MASFEEHIAQAKSNLKFLEEINSKANSFWDWQVTTTFYIAVHIINAHLAKTGDLHYRTHEDVKNAINPTKPLSITRIDESIYLCYVKLEGLSRRSRYLCHDSTSNRSTEAHLTNDRHFTKAIRKLDPFISHFNTLYNLNLSTTKVKSPELSAAEKLQFFSV